ISKKQYANAKKGLLQYIKNYPNGKFRPNAYYWLGEIFLLQKNYTQATVHFATVIQKFPKSPNVSDAKLKLAIAHVGQGKAAQGRKELQQVKKQYPGTTAAQLASIQLQQMEINTE